jgi:hypothetical protein
MKLRDYLLTVSAYLTSKSNQRGERRERGVERERVKGERGGGRERQIEIERKEREVEQERD